MAKRKYEPPLCECKGCHYWRSAVNEGTIHMCHYSIETGIVRGIPPIDCYKHENTPYRKKGKKNVKNIKNHTRD